MLYCTTLERQFHVECDEFSSPHISCERLPLVVTYRLYHEDEKRKSSFRCVFDSYWIGRRSPCYPSSTASQGRVWGFTTASPTLPHLSGLGGKCCSSLLPVNFLILGYDIIDLKLPRILIVLLKKVVLKIVWKSGI